MSRRALVALEICEVEMSDIRTVGTFEPSLSLLIVLLLTFHLSGIKARLNSMGFWGAGDTCENVL